MLEREDSWKEPGLERDHGVRAEEALARRDHFDEARQTAELSLRAEGWLEPVHRGLNVSHKAGP